VRTYSKTKRPSFDDRSGYIQRPIFISHVVWHDLDCRNVHYAGCVYSCSIRFSSRVVLVILLEQEQAQVLVPVQERAQDLAQGPDWVQVLMLLVAVVLFPLLSIFVLPPFSVLHSPSLYDFYFLPEELQNPVHCT
jgi:hypothetical protein